MMTTRRHAATVVLMMLAAAALILTGCGGGDGGVQSAQTGTVTGTITYASTGAPLGGIEVSIGDITTTTDDDGTFTLRRVPTGSQTLVIEAGPDRGLVIPPGVPLTVDVVGGETTELSAPIQMIDDVDTPPAPPQG
ncbi:MAG: carboxypeptidase regulatory-like domain-containing protein [Armatimonadota bacterium]